MHKTHIIEIAKQLFDDIKLNDKLIIINKNRKLTIQIDEASKPRKTHEVATTEDTMGEIQIGDRLLIINNENHTCLIIYLTVKNTTIDALQ